jgi:hypothetical protein
VFVISSCNQVHTNSASLRDTPSSTDDVELIEKGSPINPTDVVATFGSDLKTEGYRVEAYSRIKAAFSGLTLTTEKNAEGKYVFSGKLKAFWGKYFQHEALAAAEWPRDQFKDEIWADLRESTLKTALISKKLSENLRIYYFPTRVGFEKEQYKISDVLLVAYVAPDSGKRGFYTFRNGKLYGLAGGKFPKTIDEASLMSDIEAGTQKVGDVEGKKPGQVEHDEFIPANLYATKSFVPGSDDLGKPVEGDTTPLQNILDAYLKKAEPAAGDLEAVLKFLAAL